MGHAPSFLSTFRTVSLRNFSSSLPHLPPHSPSSHFSSLVELECSVSVGEIEQGETRLCLCPPTLCLCVCPLSPVPVVCVCGLPPFLASLFFLILVVLVLVKK